MFVHDLTDDDNDDEADHGDDIVDDYDDDVEADHGGDTVVDNDDEADHCSDIVDDEDGKLRERRMTVYPSDMEEADASAAEDMEDGSREVAGMGGGWGRIVFPPVRRGRHVAMNVCRACKGNAAEGEFERVVVTRSKNPLLHRQARKSLWGDLWPF